MMGVANVRSECLLQLWDHLQANGIKIPVPGPATVLVKRPSDPA
jgi:hypothetical protein